MPDYAKLTDGRRFKAFVERLEEHIDDPDYDWAEDTISGILDNVVMTGRFTEAQEEAISNIEAAIDRRADL